MINSLFYSLISFWRKPEILRRFTELRKPLFPFPFWRKPEILKRFTELRKPLFPFPFGGSQKLSWYTHEFATFRSCRYHADRHPQKAAHCGYIRLSLHWKIIKIITVI